MKTKLATLCLFSLAAGVLGVSSAAYAQAPTDPNYIPWGGRRQYSERPITAAFQHIDMHFGMGAEYVDYYRYYSSIGAPLGSFGSHFDMVYGLTDFFELGGGFAIRVPGSYRDLPYVNPERYARVNRDWIPTGLELSRQPYALGHENITNPYVHGRIAMVNRAPVYVAFDLTFTIPFANRSCFTIDPGIPVHFILARIVRIETGIYNEFIACQIPQDQGSITDYWSLVIPARVLVNFTERFWMGIRSGFTSVGYRINPENIAVPLGLETGIRLTPRVDLMFSFTAPEFIHTDPVTQRNVWFSRFGGGVALQLFLL